jgi:hypothetical protein
MKNIFKPVFVLLSLLSALGTKAQVPAMNSYPSASAVLYLDFDGHTVEGTSFNFYGPIYCAGSGMNNTQIVEVFNRVSEDYRPFNINVTTDSTKFLAAPDNKRMRVILTVTSDWYGNAGGVAFINSFTWADDSPCFVFTALLSYNVKNVAEAASHEAGHTLGLYHQSTYDDNCVKIAEYNQGTGGGEIGWAPIMGVGYYRNFTLWNNGPNPYGCNILQNDLDIITTGNNFSYRSDDYSASFNGTTQAHFNNTGAFVVSGVVERNTDQDMIKFTLSAPGRFLLTAIPYNVGTGNNGSDLDLQVTLYNSSQTQLNVYNPGTLLSSVIDTVISSGTYFLKIEGKGNVYAPNYASLGSYSLQGNYSASTLPLRRLELHGAVNGNKHELDWLIDADEQVIEQILEVSTDGRNFSPVVHSPVNDRAYIYIPQVTSNAQYRLNVTFDNGHQYYSNIVTLRVNGSKQRPQLINNLVSTGTVGVNSPGLFTYTICDFNGKVTGKGQLTNGFNSINITNMAAGMYIIRFTNGNEQWAEKMVRQ